MVWREGVSHTGCRIPRPAWCVEPSETNGLTIVSQDWPIRSWRGFQLRSRNSAELVGQDGILRPIGNRPFREWRFIARGSINNRPQDYILPHLRSCGIIPGPPQASLRLPLALFESCL